jgi:hypothetical protein
MAIIDTQVHPMRHNTLATQAQRAEKHVTFAPGSRLKSRKRNATGTKMTACLRETMIAIGLDLRWATDCESSVAHG